MKIITETFLVMTCALLCMIVLPFGGLVGAGLAISDKWHSFMAHDGDAFVIQARRHQT